MYLGHRAFNTPSFLQVLEGKPDFLFAFQMQTCRLGS